MQIPANIPLDDPLWEEHRRQQYSRWTRRATRLFIRFVLMFGMIVLLAMGGMAVVTAVLTNLFGQSSGHITFFAGLIGCGLSVALPILATAISIRAFRDIARPLGEVMSAADAVAEGDLTVRLPERRGEFGKLARSFNRMVTEIAQAEEHRRSLTADVAHELRTPLHILQGNIEGLIDGVYQPTPEHLNMMLDETQLLARLIDDLRTLSLAESGHLPLHVDPVAATDLLADVATSFSGIAESQGIALHVEAGSLNGHMIPVDAMRINQVLGNLVANALRYTPEGGSVTLAGVPIDGGVRLTIRDTGVGIAPDDLPHIFDRFWKADKSRNRESGGSGLGLAIARQLVHLHGGQISVQSEVDRGTVFTIDLPDDQQTVTQQ